MTKKIMQAGLKLHHSEVREQFCDYLRQDDIQGRKGFIKQILMLVKNYSNLLDELATCSMQQNLLNLRYYAYLKYHVYHPPKR